VQKIKIISPFIHCDSHCLQRNSATRRYFFKSRKVKKLTQRCIEQKKSRSLIFQDNDLILECSYDSTKQANATVGGYGTPEEMCMTFLQFYPKTDDMIDMVSLFESIPSCLFCKSCMSYFDLTALLMLLGLKNNSIENLKADSNSNKIPNVTLNGKATSVVDFYNTNLSW
jgi:hypothetical protein